MSYITARNPIWPDEYAHPELRTGELFFRNMSSREYAELAMQSKRMGLIAYDGRGNRLSAVDWFPVFLSESEVRERQLTIKQLRASFPDLPARTDSY